MPPPAALGFFTTRPHPPDSRRHRLERGTETAGRGLAVHSCSPVPGEPNERNRNEAGSNR
jgi:hypothetical protein